MKKLSVFMVIMAGEFWGTMGVFVRWFSEMGFSPMQIAAMRITSCAVSLVIIAALIGGKKVFKIRLRDLGWFLSSGVLSVLGMSWLYFEAIDRSSMCLSAILLYTAPFIVTLLSCVFFGERFTISKFIALITAFVGCVMVTGTDGEATVIGVCFGLASGVAYALYSIFGKVLLKRYSPMTVTVYSFCIAAIAFMFVTDIDGIVSLVSVSEMPVATFVGFVVMGVFTATAPFMLYTYGLNGLDAGTASVMAYTEPLVAAICGYIFFGEFSGYVAILGILLIIFAVLLINNFGRIKK